MQCENFRAIGPHLGALQRVVVNEDKAVEAELQLGSTETTALEGLFHELRGDIRYAREDYDGARDAYQDALDADTAGIIDRNFVQLKLDDVTGLIGQTDALAAQPAVEIVEESLAREDTGQVRPRQFCQCRGVLLHRPSAPCFRAILATRDPSGPGCKEAVSPL